MKRIITVVIILLLLIGITSALSAGTADDPLISLSYITDTFIPGLLSQIGISASEKLDPVYDSAMAELDMLTAGYVFNDPGFTFVSGYIPINAIAGATLEIAPGSVVVLNEGTALLTVSSGEVINLSSGSSVSSGTVAENKVRYFTAEDAYATITVYSDSANLTVDGSYRFTQGSGTAPGILFTDIPSGHWATSYIYYISQRGLMNGMGGFSFAPETTMTRAMFVTVIGRLAGVNTASYTYSSFSDVDIGQWYGPYVAWASQNGIVTGYDDGTFRPTASITREQMAVIIIRYASYAGMTLGAVSEEMQFADASSISSWAVNAVQTAQRAGLINGKPGGIFDPAGTATRAEVCTVMYRLIA